ncbi:MAG TPA: PfkB family carbohydrate kinase [Luteolibacter sp.]|nr:PfkB family carbohydrate kinase [Luteolibacter sp.]
MTPKEILAALPKLKLLVIGDLILDHYIWGDVHRISPEAPVPVVHATRDTHTAGGAANVAHNLSSLRAQTALIGALGQDGHGDTLLEILGAAGIDTSGCLRLGHAPTIVKTRVIVRTQQLCRIDREASRASYGVALTPETGAMLEAAIRRADAIIVSDYAKGLISQELLDRVCALAAQHGKWLAVDPKPARHLDFKGVGLITPNRHEALELAGLPEPCFGEAYPLEEACRLICARYEPKTLVITLGADGMAVCQNGKILKVLPTSAREVFDVSGAGDTVIATLSAALAAGADPLSAAAFANLAAGIVVSKVGTATPLPEELLAH